MSLSIALSFLLFLSGRTAFSAYRYALTDTLRQVSGASSAWWVNGAVLETARGLSIPGEEGSSVISRNMPADSTDGYELAATVDVRSSGGTYVLFLEATPEYAPIATRQRGLRKEVRPVPAQAILIASDGAHTLEQMAQELQIAVARFAGSPHS